MYYLPNLYFSEFYSQNENSSKDRSESSSMAKVRSQQRIEVATRSHTILNEKKEVTEIEKGIQGRISCHNTILRSRHRRKTTLVATDN